MFGTLCLLLLCLVFVPQLAFANVADGIISVVNFLVGGFAQGLEWLVSLFQFLFLQVIQFTILDFANHWKDNGLLSDFRVVWQVLRDFVNLIIVVFFVLTAMMTVLDVKGQFGFHRKGLVWLIAAAVFVNFSAFFTLLIIDISHILFMLFFNVLDVSTLESFSPFSGYSEVLGDTASDFFNIILGIIASLVNWFIILGILYFCIILIERYIIAMFLVLLSPFAALGFFTSISGGNPLANKISSFYEMWKERLGYVFTMPVTLIVGFALLLVLFRGALGQMVDPDNFVKLIGVNTPEGRGILLQLMLASIVLILGIFKVGEFAKEANFHPAIAKKFKFGFGEFMSKRALSLAKGKPFRPFLNKARALPVVGKPLYNMRKGLQKFADAKPDSFAGRAAKVATKVPGVGTSLDVVGRAKRGWKDVQAADQSAFGDREKADALRAENVMERKIKGVIATGTVKEKVALLEDAADKKKGITLTPGQLAELSQNESPEVLKRVAAMDGVSGDAQDAIYQKINKQISKGAEELVDSEDVHKRAEIAHDKAQQQQKVAADKKEKELQMTTYDGRVNAALEEFEQGDVYKNFQKSLDPQKQNLEQARRSGNTAAVSAIEQTIKKSTDNFYKTTAMTDSSYKKFEALGRMTPQMIKQINLAAGTKQRRIEAKYASELDTLDRAVKQTRVEQKVAARKLKRARGYQAERAETLAHVGSNKATRVGTATRISSQMNNDKELKAVRAEIADLESRGEFVGKDIRMKEENLSARNADATLKRIKQAKQAIRDEYKKKADAKEEHQGGRYEGQPYKRDHYRSDDKYKALEEQEAALKRVQGGATVFDRGAESAKASAKKSSPKKKSSGS